MTTPLPSAPDPLPRPITSALEAQDVIERLSDVMDALLCIVDQETALVRAGRLREAAKLEPTKSNLAQFYVADSTRLKISRPYLSQTSSGVLATLRERHQSFQARLQVNLTVLATAHAVSEGIMRGLSQDINRSHRRSAAQAGLKPAAIHRGRAPAARSGQSHRTQGCEEFSLNPSAPAHNALVTNANKFLVSGGVRCLRSQEEISGLQLVAEDCLRLFAWNPSIP
jgi:hypothetical protein